MRRVLCCVLLVGLVAGCVAKPANVSLEGPGTTTETTATPTTAATPAAPIEVARWSGIIDTDTENFTVSESWELHWKMPYTGSGTWIGIAWKDPATEFGGGLVQPTTAEGSSLIRQGGTFYLHISLYEAKSYEVWVVDVPN